MTKFWFPIVLLMFACAHGSDPYGARENQPLPNRPDCHSSVEAVLTHSDELRLTAEQVVALSAIDQRLRAENESIASRKVEGGKASGGSPPAGSGNPGAQGSTPSPQGGAGNSGGPGGRMGGGRGRGRMPMGGSNGSPAPGGHTAKSMEERMDENDSKAYFDAEEILDASQRERAREVAEDYRERLFDWREALRHRPDTSK